VRGGDGLVAATEAHARCLRKASTSTALAAAEARPKRVRKLAPIDGWQTAPAAVARRVAEQAAQEDATEGRGGCDEGGGGPQCACGPSFKPTQLKAARAPRGGRCGLLPTGRCQTVALDNKLTQSNVDS
jgi:hypothetical protein